MSHARGSGRGGHRIAALWAIVAAAGVARGQVTCDRPVGPDLIISDITGTVSYPAVGGRSAFGAGAKQTDVGNVWINYQIQGANANRHPVTGQGLYRLSTASGPARFEQIGQSWLFHGILALSANVPCSTCVAPPDGTHLGTGCTTTDTASIVSAQPGLGPRWQVNPHTGVFAYPAASPGYTGSVARRLQALSSDIQPGNQYAYFVEVHAIAADDAAAGNGNNNASYRPCTISVISTPYNLVLTGVTVPERAAISAWSSADPLVLQATAQVPGDGLFIVSSRATDVGGGMWHYEFAAYNMNADSGGGSFSVAVPASATVANLGFHDVDYTDGDGELSVTRDGTDWAAVRSGGTITWSTTPYAANPNGNGLLWGTLYNFRFDASVPPANGQVSLGLWKTPGVSLAIAAQVPGAACYANCDGSTTPPVLNVNDFVCFQAEFAAGDSRANCDGSTSPPVLNVSDFVCFQGAFAAGCL